MRSILLVKTSSLGDVVHNLPVASDIHARFPQARIDWVDMATKGFLNCRRDALRSARRFEETCHTLPQRATRPAGQIAR
mgnify:CR=1 FL=1